MNNHETPGSQQPASDEKETKAQIGSPKDTMGSLILIVLSLLPKLHRRGVIDGQKFTDELMELAEKVGKGTNSPGLMPTLGSMLETLRSVVADEKENPRNSGKKSEAEQGGDNS